MSTNGLTEIFTTFGNFIRGVIEKWPYRYGFGATENGGTYSLQEMKEVYENFTPVAKNLNFLLGITATNEQYKGTEDEHTLNLDFLFINNIRLKPNSQNIKKIVGETLEQLPEGCFNYLLSLEEVSLPRVSTVEGNCFIGCSNLKNFYSTSLTRVFQGAFQNCGSLTNIDLSNLIEIGSNSFRGCSFSEINISSWVASSYALGRQFLDNKNLETVNWGNSNSDIPEECFKNCTSLKNFNKEGTTECIGVSAFENCSSLNKIKIKQGDKYIRIFQKAFYNCSSLTQLEIEEVERTSIALLVDVNAFEGTPIAQGKGYIYVPDERLQAYKEGINWSQYASQIKPRSEIPQ